MEILKTIKSAIIKHPYILTIFICGTIGFCTTFIVNIIMGPDYHLLYSHIDFFIFVTLVACILLYICNTIFNSFSRIASVFIVYSFCILLLYILFITTYPVGSFARFVLFFKTNAIQKIHFLNMQTKIQKGMTCEEIGHMFGVSDNVQFNPGEIPSVHHDCMSFHINKELGFPSGKTLSYCVDFYTIKVSYDSNGKVIDFFDKGGCAID